MQNDSSRTQNIGISFRKQVEVVKIGYEKRCRRMKERADWDMVERILQLADIADRPECLAKLSEGQVKEFRLAISKVQLPSAQIQQLLDTAGKR